MIKGVLCLITLFVAKSAWAEHILYVDGVGADPGTYATIQDAIDDAKPGDVIEVAAGTYSITPSLNININNLTLRNKEGHRPVIQPIPTPNKYTEAPTHRHTTDQTTGYKSDVGLINISSADGITLKGFEIKYPHNNTNLHGVVVKNSTNTVITDNIITGFEAGLYIDDSTNPIVQKNTITGNDIGVYVFLSTNIAIYQNNIFNNGVHDLAYSNNTNINATCNWWGGTDLDEIAERIKNYEEGLEEQATWIPISENKDLPCLYKMFRLEIIVKEQIEQ